jgi:hypothetical protein
MSRGAAHCRSDTKPWTAALVLLAWVLCASCNVHVRVGQRPNPDVLETSLRIGESTHDDVRAALGNPDGTGREMLPIGDKPREVWSYYYEEGDLHDDRRIFLFVFFDQDRYDGYMWFSSLPQ